MVDVSIRCHPCVPLPADELERWLEQLAARLRETTPQSTVRLSRLRQGLPSGEVGIGWLVELSATDDEFGAAREVLVEALRDMRLIGLQPTLLAPVEIFDWPWHEDVEAAHSPHANSGAK